MYVHVCLYYIISMPTASVEAHIKVQICIGYNQIKYKAYKQITKHNNQTNNTSGNAVPTFVYICHHVHLSTISFSLYLFFVFNMERLILCDGHSNRSASFLPLGGYGDACSAGEAFPRMSSSFGRCCPECRVSQVVSRGVCKRKYVSSEIWQLFRRLLHKPGHL